MSTMESSGSKEWGRSLPGGAPGAARRKHQVEYSDSSARGGLGEILARLVSARTFFPVCFAGAECLIGQAVVGRGGFGCWI